MVDSIFEKMKSGEAARLHPTVPDSKKEEKATAILLATFRVVPDFARAMLSGAGIKVGKRSQIECYTEVALEIPGEKRKIRPDGLIVITTGKKRWTAFIESKTGTSELKQDQCEEYLQLAKLLGIDAVLTISNQYSTVPTHHPIRVSKAKTKKVGFFHFSWLSIMYSATLQIDSHSIEDPEQAFLLKELIRFLKHPSSGVSTFSRMPKDWTTLCSAVKQGAALKKTDPMLSEVVLSWHQLVRFLALELTASVSEPVQVKLARKYIKESSERVADDKDRVLKSATLISELSIPNAASPMLVAADLRRRTLNLGMKLEAPGDKKRASATINWLLRQLKGLERDDLLIRAIWPRRTPDTTASLAQAREDVNCLIHENTKDLPQSFEVIRVIDLAGKFGGVKTFVESAANEVPAFYKDVGEHLRAWVAPPPKLKSKEQASKSDSEGNIDVNKEPTEAKEGSARDMPEKRSEDVPRERSMIELPDWYSRG
ncbi:hypothetical protein [Lentisalinibacter orientalis]|uniref:hypothetical protein n=1 Tax=Lentisalinibacter orientalis TaxID=2992241 RepID=UPI003865CB42